MKSGEQQRTKLGSYIDKNSNNQTPEDPSAKPMIYSKDKSGESLSPVDNKADEDDHLDHHSTTVSRLSMIVFLILLVMISIGVYMLFVNWPKVISDQSADNRSASLAKALLTWYEQEIADPHEDESIDDGGHGGAGHEMGTDKNQDHHEEEKFYWEETWPEPKEEDEDHGDEEEHHREDQGSAEESEREPEPISSKDESKTGPRKDNSDVTGGSGSGQPGGGSNKNANSQAIGGSITDDDAYDDDDDDGDDEGDEEVDE